ALKKRMDEATAEVAESGDFLARAALESGLANSYWLFLDDPEHAAKRSRTAVEPFPKATFQSPHYFDFIAQTQVELYTGEGEAAWERVEATWPKLVRALFLRMQFFRIEARFLRARAALACARNAKDARRKVLIHHAEED